MHAYMIIHVCELGVHGTRDFSCSHRFLINVGKTAIVNLQENHKTLFREQSMSARRLKERRERWLECGWVIPG